MGRLLDQRVGLARQRERERESGTVEQWMSVGKDGDGNNQWGGNEARREERGRGTSRRPNKTDLSMLAQI